jgi:hypothetical protein
MSKKLVVLAGIVLVATGILGACSFEQAEARPQWEVEGHYSEACRCEVICPCVLGKGPTYDTCDTTMVFQINKGRYEDVVLDGLYAITFSNERYYLDERANEQQRRALEEISKELAEDVYGRPLAPPAAVDPVKVVSIQATMTLDRVEARIPDVLELRAERLMESGGDQPWEIMDRPISIKWMPHKWAGKSAIYKFEDASDGRKWNLSGRSAQFGAFKANSGMFGSQAPPQATQD